MSNDPKQDGLIYQSIKVLAPTTRDAIPIAVDDWNGLIDRIKGCKASVRRWPIAYSVAISVAITVGISMFVIDFNQFSNWVFSAYVSVTALSIGVAIVSVIADRLTQRYQRDNVDLLVSDMERIRSQFVPTAYDNQEYRS